MEQQTKPTNREKLKEITDSIETGIKELFQSDKYMNYLKVMSRFHNYSVNNRILIHLQKPDATKVASYNKWHEQFERNVRKDEKGIRIIAPVNVQRTVDYELRDKATGQPIMDENGNPIKEKKEITVREFRPTVVFDVSQTEGKPLPEIVSDLHGNVENYDVFMEAIRGIAGFPLTIEPMADNLDGYFNKLDNTIHIREGMSEVQTVSAALHEIAHSRLHLEYGNNLDNKEKLDSVIVFGNEGLFSNNRIPDDMIPKGMYKYEIRGNTEDSEVFEMLEEHVDVDFAGTIITDKPVDLGEDGFIPTEDNIIFRGYDSTIRDFWEDHVKDKRTKEVEAESISFTVCNYYGIETGENSFGYIASWSDGKDLKELKSSLEITNKTSDSLIQGIDRLYSEIMKDRGLIEKTNADVTVEKKEITQEDFEKKFAEAKDNSLLIYQLKTDAPEELKEMPIEFIRETPDKGNYDCVYYQKTDEFDESTISGILEEAYVKFNKSMPDDYMGRRMAVSDIVAVKYNGEVSYNYCNSNGFIVLDEFADKSRSRSTEKKSVVKKLKEPLKGNKVKKDDIKKEVQR